MALTATLPEEARKIREGRLNLRLVELLAGDRSPVGGERQALALLSRELGDRLYAEALYVLTHRSTDAAKARDLFFAMNDHKRWMEERLGRPVGIRTAAMDYLRNVRGRAEDLVLVGESTMRRLAGAAARDELSEEAGSEIFRLDLRREIERTRRYGEHFAVLFVDVDDLHRLGESHGSRSAAAAAKSIGETLNSSTRLTDTVYRLGAGRFAVFLANCEPETAGSVAEKLRKAVHALRLRSEDGREFSVTVSIGAAPFDSQTVGDVEEIFNKGELLLTEARRAGKDRVAVIRRGPEGEQIVPLAERLVAPREEQGRFVVRGTGISRGIAVGRAFLHKDILSEELSSYEIREAEITGELERVREAFEHVRNDIETMERQVRVNLGREYGDIFLVHKTILGDLHLVNEMEERMRRERRNAEHIVRSVFRRFENMFVTSENEMTREKSYDIADLSRRVLRHLTGAERNIFGKLPPNTIVVAKRLLPSESVHLRRSSVKAIVTEKGSRNSHAAILARGLGIPYVSETELPIERIPHGAPLIVDATRGEIIVNPSMRERAEVRSRIRLQQRETAVMIEKFRKVQLEKNGLRYRVMANVNTKYNIREAVEYGCDGVGLYRIEQLYMQSRVFPTQEQLLRTLDDYFDELRDKEITIRLLDVGGDKVLPYINMKDDTYSFLGVRGIRFLLRYPKLLETQLLVLLRLSKKYRLKVLIPMVTLPDEITAVRDVLERCKTALDENSIPFDRHLPLGPMIEVPAAAIRIDEIVAHADFISIGTNDLIQYTMASSRENAGLARYYEEGTGVVLGYIGQAVKAARRKGIDCGLCGELAADTSCTATLVRLGLSDFSVSPSNIPKLKSRIAGILSIPIK